MQSASIVFILSFVLLIPGCNIARDQTDVRNLASRVHSQMQDGDFSAIHRESASRFKGVGSESQFVSLMQQIYEERGTIKKVEEVAYLISYDLNTGKTYTVIFNLVYQQGHAQERMIFARSDKGQLQLWKLDIDPMS